MSCLQASDPDQYTAGDNNPEACARLGDVEDAGDQARGRNNDTDLAYGCI